MSSATKWWIAEANGQPAPTGLPPVQPVPAPIQPAPSAPPATDAAIPFPSYFGSSSIPFVSGGSMSNLIVPPGGFAGFAQQTPATQQLFARAGRVGGRRSAAKRRRSRTAKKKAARVGAKRRRSSARGKLRKGSAAAKRRMAQLRRMRRKR